MNTSSKSIVLFLTLFSFNSFSIHVSAILDKTTSVWTLSCDDQKIKVDGCGNIIESNFNSHEIKKLENELGIVITVKHKNQDCSFTLYKNGNDLLSSSLLFNAIEYPSYLRAMIRS